MFPILFCFALGISRFPWDDVSSLISSSSAEHSFKTKDRGSAKRVTYISKKIILSKNWYLYCQILFDQTWPGFCLRPTAKLSAEGLESTFNTLNHLMTAEGTVGHILRKSRTGHGISNLSIPSQFTTMGCLLISRTFYPPERRYCSDDNKIIREIACFEGAKGQPGSEAAVSFYYRRLIINWIR
jgi:hypothetical protein